jgi:SAM-dependent methyltransferase
VSSPLALYAEWLQAPAEPAIVRFADGTMSRALVERWTGAADAVDERALRGLAGPVLDIGCGPGRHLHALARQGVFALGVDLSPAAVRLARGRGGRAIVGSVFGEVVHPGRWASALLLDGNIGIGGCPERLLRRVRGLLQEGGRAVIEVGAPGRPTSCGEVRLETAAAESEWFPWAEVSADGADAVLTDAGFRTVARWDAGGRWFVVAAAR